MPHGWNMDYNHAERRLWQDPQAILQAIGLKAGDTLADIGAGDGYFSIPAAAMVGAAGTIYALDLSPEALASLQTKAAADCLKNIRTIVGDVEQVVICRQCADVVLLANVLHDFTHPLVALANIRSMLKPGGILADLDWKKEPLQAHGPPLAKRLNQDEATALLHQASFRMTKGTLSGPFHYLLLAEPE
jgi:ubiquinone/menaquinone biosynthesis C-methylase UbiE